MSILAWILIGLIAGFLAKAFVPGEGPGGFIGGRAYEPSEENPMLGFRGAVRYVDENFRPCFVLLVILRALGGRRTVV